MTTSVADAFAVLLRANPAAPVAWTSAGVLTRAHVEAESRMVEQLLAQIPRGRRIAMSVRDGSKFLPVFLALVRRGDAAVLLDAADPRAPRLDLATRLGAIALVTDTPELGVHLCQGTAEAAAYRAIKLTSGSTGNPAPIGVGDVELLADAEQLERAMGIGDEDRVFAAVPMSFSYGVGNLLVPALARGRCLVLPEAGPIGLLQALRNGEPTVLPAVPALLRTLLKGTFAMPASMRLILSAGATLLPDVAAQFRRRFGLAVHAFYGSTESGGVSYDHLGTAAERGSVGTPMDGVTVTIGAGGRLDIQSPAVGDALDGRGNPLHGRFAAQDLGALDGGELFLRGRTGQVFDVGGHKVDPGEIERLIAEFPSVVEVAVVPFRDDHGRACCAAVIAGADLVVKDVRRHCARVLPLAKVPRHFVVVEQLPRSQRGKVSREALQELLLGGDARSSG